MELKYFHMYVHYEDPVLYKHKYMHVIYLEGKLSFRIIQHNLFTYRLPYSIFKSLPISCLSVVLQSVLQTIIKVSQMPGSVINIREALLTIH